MLFVWAVTIVAALHLISPTNAGCSKEEFVCLVGEQCVRKDKWCDENEDCDDGSDEAYCKNRSWFNPDPNNCRAIPETLILCPDGPCIPVSAKCDGHDDCKDGFDEKYCKVEITVAAKTTTEDFSSEYSDETNDESDEVTTAPDVGTLSSTAAPKTLPKIDTVVLSTKADEDNDNWSSSTSYYQSRIKEADSNTEAKSLPSTRQTSVATKAPTRSTAAPSTRTYSTSSTTPRTKPSFSSPPTRSTYRPRLTSTPLHTQSFNAHDAGKRRPPLFVNAPTRSESNYPRQHNRQLNQHTYRQQFSSYPGANQQLNRYQSSSYPGANQQNNRYQPSSNQRINHQTSRYQSPNSNQELNRYPHRPINGEPDLRYQTTHLALYPKEPGSRKPFFFSKDYESLFGRHVNRHAVRNGESWILSQRTSSGDWGKDTARALIALVLANNSFLTGDQAVDEDREVMKRRFMIQLGADLIRNGSTTMSVSRMASAVNALLAVCENPSDFHGMDLVEMLKNGVIRSRSHQSPFVYLSLCLSGTSLGSSEIQSLMKLMTPHSLHIERTKDTQIAAIMALSCHIHQSSAVDLLVPLRNGITQLLQRVHDDGSFGSVYSTALAAQALMSSNDTSSWNAEKTMDFLREHQQEDGSFGDLLATYYVLPALSGRSLLHLRNIQCGSVEKELTPQDILHFAGPKQYIHYSIYLGYPLSNSFSLSLLLPKGVNFLDVMKVAQYQDENFRFAVDNGGKVYSVSGLANDHEQGLSWYLYTKNELDQYQHEPNSRERYTGDIKKLFPQSEQHLIFWYHSNELHLRRTD